MAKYDNSKQIEFYKVQIVYCFVMIRIELTLSFAITNQLTIFSVETCNRIKPC